MEEGDLGRGDVYLWEVKHQRTGQGTKQLKS